MTDSDLIEAFLNTNYVITSDVFQGGRLILNIGNHHPELNDYWPDLESWAFITAWNPLPSVLSVKENADRNLQLEQDLNAHNYKYISGYGADKEEQWKEDSYFILNIAKDIAKGLGDKYGQKAIVFGEKGKLAELIVLK